MAQAPDNSINLSEVILDLDEITNIAHPCWEYIQPNPSIHELFDEYNQLFFDGILEFEVDIDWSSLENYNSGETVPAEKTKKGRRMTIVLNENILRNRMRHEIIETLIHEMIHAYLIKTNREDKGRGVDYHGDNFKAKMNEINCSTGLNITVNHDFVVNRKETHYKWLCWRCQGNCRNMPPYFGFIWVRGDRRNKEPSPADMMWINPDKCYHQFEMLGTDGDPKAMLHYWDCISIFNKFVSENNIRIKTKKIPLYVDGNLLPIDDTAVSETNESETNESEITSIENKHYVNFDRETKKILNIDDYLKVNTMNSVQDDSRTVCMMCLGKIADDSVIEHLYNCTGIEFTMDSEESLPIFKID